MFLKQSTEIKIRVGPFMDKGDAVTPETGVTLAGADQAELLKANGAATVSIISNTWAAISGCDGWYDLTLTATDTNTIGELVVVVQDSAVSCPVFPRFQVVEESVYDNLFASGAVGPLTATQVQTAADAALVGRDLDHLINVATPGNPTANSWLDILFNVTGETLFDRDFASLSALAGARTLLPNRQDYNRLLVIAGSSTTEVRTNADEADDFWNGQVLVVQRSATGGAGAGRIIDFANTNGAFTISPALPFTPAADDVCYVVALPLANLDAAVSDVEADTQDIQSRLPAALVSGRIDANVGAISDDATAADNLEADYDGTGLNRANSEIGTVATLTGHTPQTGDSYARLGAPAGASVSADLAAVAANVSTLLSRITATLFTGITSLAEWLGIMAGKQVGDATARAEIRATGAGSGTYDETDDSQEAQRDQGDAAWVTATGFSTHDENDVRDAILDDATRFSGADIDDIVEDTNEIQGTVAANLDATISSVATAIAGLNDPTAATIADAIWDELQSGHTDSGSFGELMKLVLQYLENKLITDPSTGIATLYDDGGSPLKTSQHYEDAAGTQTYRGDGAERRERFT